MGAAVGDRHQAERRRENAGDDRAAPDRGGRGQTRADDAHGAEPSGAVGAATAIGGIIGEVGGDLDR